MRYSLIFAGMATMAAGQSLDLGLVSAAPDPIATGPDVTAIAETITYAAASIGSAAVTATAAAAVDKRQLEARTFGSSNNLLCKWFGWGCPPPVYTPPVYTPPKATPTSTSSTASSTTSSSFSMNTGIPTPTGIPSTCTNTWTNTNAFTSATGCPNLFEVGTYCGFVNPEDPCADQPKGSGPVAVPDTAAGFLASAVLKNIVLGASTPAGYAQTFSNLAGSTSAASYLGLQTLTSYDVAGCAAACDKTSTCTSFNIYAERDPALNPSTTYCCPNPASLTNYKCTLWGSVIDATTATNTGQWREGFQVVIAGSNGYTKANTTTPVTPPGWTNPQKCGGVHSHDKTCISKQFFPGPYNPQLCASYATAQNLKNGAVTGKVPNKNRCNFFHSYMLKKNGSPLGTYCSLFAEQYDPSVATYIPGWLGGSFYGVETSYSYCLSS